MENTLFHTICSDYGSPSPPPPRFSPLPHLPKSMSNFSLPSPPFLLLEKTNKQKQAHNDDDDVKTKLEYDKTNTKSKKESNKKHKKLIQT